MFSGAKANLKIVLSPQKDSVMQASEKLVDSVDIVPSTNSWIFEFSRNNRTKRNAINLRSQCVYEKFAWHANVQNIHLDASTICTNSPFFDVFINKQLRKLETSWKWSYAMEWHGILQQPVAREICFREKTGRGSENRAGKRGLAGRFIEKNPSRFAFVPKMVIDLPVPRFVRR